MAAGQHGSRAAGQQGSRAAGQQTSSTAALRKSMDLDEARYNMKCVHGENFVQSAWSSKKPRKNERTRTGTKGKPLQLSFRTSLI